jgi:hypothetical protein
MDPPGISPVSERAARSLATERSATVPLRHDKQQPTRHDRIGQAPVSERCVPVAEFASPASTTALPLSMLSGGVPGRR